MHPQRGDYILAGCLGVSFDESNITRDTWDAIGPKTWKSFCRKHPLDRCSDSPTQHEDDSVSADVQEHLIRLQRFHLAFILFKERWADLEFCVNEDGSHGILRVYLLPDDAYRGVIDRTNMGLRKARHRLLHLLDYSKSAWKAKSAAFADILNPLRDERASGDGKESLLEVFNNIPSPSPEIGQVSDVYSQDAMNDVLGSSVPGLITELYPYQRRSIAVMVQKEAEPGKVADPRLVAMNGQDGTQWYADPVVGTILKEPRYYDGIPGGILAEEMGAGKTIICLALILATKNLPTRPPELYRGSHLPKRRKMVSLADMAASCATRNAVPWKSYFETWRRQIGYEFDRCEAALKRNRGYYFRPPPKLRRTGRHPVRDLTPTKIYLSDATVVIVPNNLLSQWKQEIAKHTTGLRVSIVAKNETVPCLKDLLDLDILLFSQSRFEQLVKQNGGYDDAALSVVHFKRCIVDEGHKLGNSKIGRKSNLLIGLDGMNFSSRWIVTGTPSHGLFGVDNRTTTGGLTSVTEKQTLETSVEMEKKDLERLGSITSLYLKSRPWANTATENEDTRSDWGTYLLLPRHNRNSHGRWDCLKATLNSLIIRHRLSEVGDLLPPVNEKIIVLEGSFQDRLSLNLFAMMIIFNSVQSQRTDLDYFFHPRQRKSLLEIVYNLKQSSFFGGSFFTSGEIEKSVETAEKFLEEGKVLISDEDRCHLQQAIKLGKIAMDDKLRNLSNRYHEMPVWVHGPLGNAGYAWSLDGEGGDTICTSASMLLSLQRLLAKNAHDPESLNSLLNGGLIQEGLVERGKILAAQTSDKASDGKEKKKSTTLAGNTKLGEDIRRRKVRSQAVAVTPIEAFPTTALPPALQHTNLVSTVSAKLSYLIDSVVQHQADEKIIIFYENENVAFYLASVLDVVCTQHMCLSRLKRCVLTSSSFKFSI